MINIYKTNTKTGNLKLIDKPVKGCWINLVNPTEDEVREIAMKSDINEELIRYPLDLAEKAHIDLNEDALLIVVDAPVIEHTDENRNYVTMPLGMIIVRDDMFITVSSTKIDVVESMLNTSRVNHIHTDKKSRFVFQILYRVAQDYIRYLTYINKDLDTFEKNMEKTMSSRELLKIMRFEKTMIYFSASVKANQVVLEKLNRGKVLKLYEDDEEILEDTLIENRQAMEMIETYSQILNGIVDMFGTIVSNNLNIVMKILTSITIIISLPTMVSSFLGMNVEFPFDTGKIGFYTVIGISLVITILATLFLKKKDML